MGTFFIGRPVFAWVLAIMTVLAGAAAIQLLPVTQYPSIAPTEIHISATYSGASAQTVENSVTRVIEDGLTGLDGMIYMESSSTQGSSKITVTFDNSVDPVTAQSDVQTQVSQVERQLPSSVQTAGVSVRRQSSSILMVGSLISTDGKYTTAELGNILTNVVESPIERVSGVGGVHIFGSGYAMRIWLNPMSLARYQLTPNDVVDAVSAQNTNVSVGSLGAQPTTEGQQFTATITAQSQLTTVDEFKNILLKTTSDGATVRLGDVARVEIGQESYGGGSRFSGEPAAGFGVQLETGANAITTSKAVQAELDKLSGALPAGTEFKIAYDTSPFVELSIQQVYHTLIEAAVLVCLVLLAFLHTWRATLVPLIAVPVVLMGTFAVLYLADYSINTLTMFAMVLAIGLLVDDAIVVVENVERLMHEEGLGPFEATRKSMGQITSALLGINVVLSAVFLPMAFFGGATGVIYRQFSITIVTAMTLSLAVAVILSPALCARLLKPQHGEPRFAPARWFNHGLARVTGFYTGTARGLSRRLILLPVIFALIIGGAWMIYGRMTSSFLPTEDQGTLMTIVTLPEGATTQQTLDVVKKVENFYLTKEKDAVTSTFAALGFGFGGTGQNHAMLFVKLKDFSEREGHADLAAGALAQKANAYFRSIRAGQVFATQPPAIHGIGNTGGFSMYLVDQSGKGSVALQAAAKQLQEDAADDPILSSVRADSTEDQAALKISIDQQKAESFGLTLSDINSMLSVIFAGDDVNDFLLGTQLLPVYVQGEAANRMQPKDIQDWYARNSDGEMVPFSAFVTTSWSPVPPTLERYDATSAVQISGSPGTGYSSGEAMDEMTKLVDAMPGGYGTAWTGISYQERQSGSQAPLLYALSVLVVFLALAALYESWSIPFAVMLAVPVGMLGAVAAAYFLGQSNDVYFKVGVLTTIGLAARNAILIVEFAEQLRKQGRETLEAAIEAAGLRLRPILMTSFAFMLGVLPLATSSGAGAAAQNSIGIGVLGGMIASTVIGIFLVPAFYVLIRKLTTVRFRRKPETP
ncbi:efflux RND transporter permease subunit [Acidimangrovimonas sediminis]|uniref:efflux RND transporter permease subunit n=1 Tax=Acidimangrovimonas sediminis TaxID=2056283 RepID=UPI000C7F9657|nr:efflux RND transporter permease subunit [Acidimangrovimonas sediminis]